MANTQCPECGNAVAEHARVCPHCGYDPSRETSREAKKKSYWAAAIICGAVLIVFCIVFAAFYHR